MCTTTLVAHLNLLETEPGAFVKGLHLIAVAWGFAVMSYIKCKVKTSCILFCMFGR